MFSNPLESTADPLHPELPGRRKGIVTANHVPYVPIEERITIGHVQCFDHGTCGFGCFFLPTKTTMLVPLSTL